MGLTFFLYLLPIIGTIFCQTLYWKSINKEKSSFFISRLIRILLLVVSFIPVFGLVVFCFWCWVLTNEDTVLNKNKITDFFINN